MRRPSLQLLRAGRVGAGKEEEEGVLRGDGEREEAGWGWGRSASGALSRKRRRRKKWRMPPCPTTMLTMTQVGFSFLSAQRRCSLHAADSKTEKPLTKAELARKALDKKHDDHFAAFPVVITTYDLIIKDRALIGGIPWSCVLFTLVLQFPLLFLSGLAPQLCDVTLFILLDALLMRSRPETLAYARLQVHRRG
jgi:hypothetical protein